MSFVPITRRCTRCKQARPIKGGTFGHNGTGFVCAGCRKPNTSKPASAGKGIHA